MKSITPMDSGKPLMYETHMHTPLCGHAFGLPEEYAEVAAQRGLRGVIVTCHNPMPLPYSPEVRMRQHEFEEYVDMVQAAAEKMAGSVDVRLGLECDYFPGYEAWLERQLSSAEFHYVLGSVHTHVAEYQTRFWKGNVLEYQRAYFDQLAAAAESRLFDCLSHPDLVKNELPSEWNPEVLMDDIRRALDRIAAVGTALELNTSGVYKLIAEMNPFRGMLIEMRARNIPVVIGSDAHDPQRVADHFFEAIDLLEECGYENASFFIGRSRRDISLEDARRSLRPRSRARTLMTQGGRTASQIGAAAPDE